MLYFQQFLTILHLYSCKEVFLKNKAMIDDQFYKFSNLVKKHNVRKHFFFNLNQG